MGVKNIDMKRTEIINNCITCKKCNETKDIRYFEPRPENNSYRSACRQCNKGYSSSKEDKIRKCEIDFSNGLKLCSNCNIIKPVSEYGLDQFTKFKLTSHCKPCISEKSKLHRKKHSLLYKYKLDISDFNNLLILQNNCCAICNVEFKDDPKNTHVDHCHTTGRVRGILCRTCNNGLGFFKDNSEILNKAINYLNSN